MSIRAPLQGLRVLDFSSMMAGPYCGRWLADLGADVIKIEPPEGDYMRSRPPWAGGQSAYFGHLNCGKRSIVLNLKHAQARDIALALCQQADVLIEGFRPGVMRRLGLDHATLAPRCERLVYCSVSGWGQEGPRASQPAYAGIVHAAVGFDRAWQAGQGAGSPPPDCVVQIADVLAATFALNAVQAALLARTVTGRGQHIDLSLAEGMLNLMPLEIVQAQSGTPLARTSYAPVPAADGHFVVLPISQKNFEDLCDAMERAELKADPRLNIAAARVVHWDVLRREIARWAAQRSAAECVAVLERHGVPASLYGSVGEALDDPQIAQRGFLRRVSAGGQAYRVAGLPFQLAGERWADQPERAVPGLGEHTREILGELLRIDGADLDRLVAAGACGVGSP